MQWTELSVNRMKAWPFVWMKAWLITIQPNHRAICYLPNFFAVALANYCWIVIRLYIIKASIWWWSPWLLISHECSENGKFSYGYASSPGKRSSMEDFHETRVDGVDGETVGLFGVFDGKALLFWKQVSHFNKRFRITCLRCNCKRLTLHYINQMYDRFTGGTSFYC